VRLCVPFPIVARQRLGKHVPAATNTHVIIELLDAVRSTIFWGLTPCSPLKVNRRFGGIYCLHLHRRRISRTRNQHESRWQAEPGGWFLVWLNPQPWKWGLYIPPKRQLTVNGLHGVISQKIVLFITTAVRTSNPTLDAVFSVRSTSYKILGI
jgi:hypothetical protein